MYTLEMIFAIKSFCCAFYELFQMDLICSSYSSTQSKSFNVHEDKFHVLAKIEKNQFVRVYRIALFLSLAVYMLCLLRC